MGSDFELKKLRYEDIEKASWDFLVEYNRHNNMPVPVEEIAEFDLGFNIIPVNRLMKDFEIDAFISANFQNLYVDLHIYENVQTRYRYTLAHEIGHFVLHRELFQDFLFDSTEEWKRFVSEMDDVKRGWLEWQGYNFAGCLLMPKPFLENAYDALISEFSEKIRQAKSHVAERTTYIDYITDVIAGRLAPVFDVSQEAVKKRIKLLNLQDKIP